MFLKTTLPMIAAILLIYMGCTTTTVTARTWDLAVTVGKEIDFMAQNGTLIGKTIIANASTLVGIVYDDENYRMFLSDPGNKNSSIYSVNLSTKNLTVTPILNKDADPQIPSMVYDSQTRTLFWTNQNAIMKMHVPVNDLPDEPRILHELKNESPRGIALDACNRHIYWVNSNNTKPSIMRSNLDGSNRTVLITENLYEPTTIVVDHMTAKLYWIDDEEGIYYKLEQSNLDGTDRTILVHGKQQQPVDLVVDRDNIYWTDFVYRAVWKFGKNIQPGNVPVTFKFYHDRNRQADPTSIIARDNIGSAIDCRAMKMQASKGVPSTLAVPQPTVQSFNNLTVSREEDDQVAECFNGGLTEKPSGLCRCKPGYSGSRCEISACHNYCLTGECFINAKGLPICKCASSHNGLRCEHEICSGYCLNNGRCTVNEGKPSCECEYFSGARCELTFAIKEICELYCTNRQMQLTNIDTSSCRCTELNQTIEQVIDNDTFNYCTILVPLLAGFAGMLTIVVIFLSVYINKLRRRPRIKKRFLVNKGGITPLTSRPGASLPADQCEITIENCCNMNICETPCFEPKLRNATNTSRSNGIKKEEKSGLLDHMENGDNSC